LRNDPWDKKLLKYGRMFEQEMMSLSVNVSLEQALDKAWIILQKNFSPEETGIKKALIQEYWPKT